MKNKFVIPVLALLLLTAGCAIRKNLTTPLNINEGQPAINDGGDGNPAHGTKFCAPAANGSFDGNAIPLTSGQNSTDGSAWAEGGGCILRPIRDTWATLNNLEVMKFKAADSFTATRTINPKAGVTHLYEITYSKSTIIGPISWTMDWFHGFNAGTFEAPTGVFVNYQRVSGTSNIPIWSGGIVLTKINDSTTSIGIVNNFKARQSSSDNESSARSALTEMIGHARTGAPDWTRLDEGLQ